MNERTTVAIVGAGPAGLLLGHVLAAGGVPFVIVENRSREHVLSRIRAGVLEQSSVDVLDRFGLAERLHAEGLVHGGIHLQVEGRRFRVDFEHLVGRTVTVYGQQQVVLDLMRRHDELIYALHPDGFAMHSMRSPSVSRLYLQVDPGEDLAEWDDERIWAALQERLGSRGWTLRPGPITEKSITPMRSSVARTLTYGRLFLAGDAGHIVPPTGAKGLNAAIADVAMLGDALVAAAGGSETALTSYSDRALARQWKIQYFSQWMTDMLHIPGPESPPEERDFRYRSRVGQLDFVTASRFAQQTLAEQYTGLAIP